MRYANMDKKVEALRFFGPTQRIFTFLYPNFALNLAFDPDKLTTESRMGPGMHFDSDFWF